MYNTNNNELVPIPISSMASRPTSSRPHVVMKKTPAALAMYSDSTFCVESHDVQPHHIHIDGVVNSHCETRMVGWSTHNCETQPLMLVMPTSLVRHFHDAMSCHGSARISHLMSFVPYCCTTLMKSGSCSVRFCGARRCTPHTRQCIRGL